ncbi:hypothetical protein IH781_03165 [Patescibacteria group bacterium]|nr:hypothetical protein [Patescibacteria group bacterium]
MISFVKNRVALLVASAAVAAVLFNQAWHPLWQGHLQTDIIVHHQQVQEYLKTGSWSNISYKEYQPGALWFFLVPHALAAFQNDYSGYLSGTLLLNTLLLVAHALLLIRYGPRACQSGYSFS